MSGSLKFTENEIQPNASKAQHGSSQEEGHGPPGQLAFKLKEMISAQMSDLQNSIENVIQPNGEGSSHKEGQEQLPRKVKEIISEKMSDLLHSIDNEVQPNVSKAQEASQEGGQEQPSKNLEEKISGEMPDLLKSTELQPNASKAQEGFLEEEGQEPLSKKIDEMISGEMSGLKSTKNETRPNAPKAQEGCSQDEGLGQQPQNQIEMISKKLKQIISEEVGKLKQKTPEKTEPMVTDGVLDVLPLAYRFPEDHDQGNTMTDDEVKTPLSEQIQQRLMGSTKQRMTTTLVAELCASFKLPEDFVANIENIDKLVPPQSGEQKTPPTEINREFTFSERSDVWNLERRKRANGRFDTYYHHEKSGVTLRSILEVLDYLMFEMSPSKMKKLKGTANESSSEFRLHRGTYKRNRPTQTLACGFDEAENIKFVEAFFAESLQNLNSGKVAINPLISPITEDQQHEGCPLEDSSAKVLKGKRRKRGMKPTTKGESSLAPRLVGAVSTNPVEKTKIPIPDSIPAVPLDAKGKVAPPLVAVSSNPNGEDNNEAIVPASIPPVPMDAESNAAPRLEAVSAMPMVTQSIIPPCLNDFPDVPEEAEKNNIGPANPDDEGIDEWANKAEAEYYNRSLANPGEVGAVLIAESIDIEQFLEQCEDQCEDQCDDQCDDQNS